ncbi:GNAT family N-acetyltransferase [Chryseobacterium sp. 2TAF14]|uniref:GNAT family N-acetyltransferase n=1 Tax=Chryseobacterium sp. 2TAF14 TaxID=3233007 RepID=UPI003F8E8C8B
MYKFEVIDINNPKWDKLVKSAFIYDFHQTTFYHKIDNNNTSLMFVVENEEAFIAFPLVLRPIEETFWFDLTSVYGYGGPISNRSDFNFSSDFIKFFWDNFNSYCNENNIVSAFARLHPLITQDHFFSDTGQILPLNKTVAIDLKLTPEEQKRQYRKSNKSEINQLKRKGFYVEEAKTADEIDRFIEIYYETMDRVEASKNYYFSKEYFHSFLENTFFESKLLLAKFEERIVAGAIFTITDKIMQYHLAGTTEEFIRETPMKLILDEARLLGNDFSLEFLHLGGGVGGSDEDSLFRFKSGFSDVYCQFSVWRYIANQDIYDQLSKAKKESAFFPLYRS